MSHVLAATSFPFIAMMYYFNNSNLIKQVLSSLGYNYMKFKKSGPNIVHRIQGFIPAEEFLELLGYALEENEPLLVASRTELEGHATIREEVKNQDLAFEESLRIDREKEEQRIQEEKKIQDDLERLRMGRLEKEKLEEEERLRVEREKQLEVKKKEESLQRKEQISLLLPSEPERGDDIISLMVRLHCGKKITRRFRLDDPIKFLFMYVDTQVTVDAFELGLSYPQRKLEDNGESFREAQIPNNAVFYVM